MESIITREAAWDIYSAEEYHQDYLDKNPTGYCHLPESLFEFARKANKPSGA